MVRYKVISARQALDQLKEIVDFISNTASVQTAQKVADGILEAIEALEYLPHRHPILRTIEKKEVAYRYARKWRYKIVYRIIEDPPEVRIVTIFHGSQAPQKLEDILD